MAGHTPGPWNVGKGQWPHAFSWVITSADMPNPGSPLAILQDFDDAAEADARLIAAAPEMYEALKAIVEGPPGEGLFSRARAAITKAEGR
jgi:hypothetical protein